MPTTRSIVFIVDSDPRASARPAEAVRIAAGVGAWKQVDVKLYLRGPAVLALSPEPDDCVDGDCFTQYLPIIGEIAPPVYVQKECPFLAEVVEPAVPIQALHDDELAGLTARCDSLVHF